MIVQLENCDWESGGIWKARIDLKWILDNAGKYQLNRYDNVKELIYSKVKAKKVLKLIKQIADEKTQEEVERFLRKYPTYYKYWQSIRG